MKKYGLHCSSTNSLCRVLSHFDMLLKSKSEADEDGYFGTDDINFAFQYRSQFDEYFNNSHGRIEYTVIEKIK